MKKCFECCVAKTVAKDAIAVIARIASAIIVVCSGFALAGVLFVAASWTLGVGVFLMLAYGFDVLLPIIRGTDVILYGLTFGISCVLLACIPEMRGGDLCGLHGYWQDVKRKCRGEV